MKIIQYLSPGKDFPQNFIMERKEEFKKAIIQVTRARLQLRDQDDVEVIFLGE